VSSVVLLQDVGVYVSSENGENNEGQGALFQEFYFSEGAKFPCMEVAVYAPPSRNSDGLFPARLSVELSGLTTHRDNSDSMFRGRFGVLPFTFPDSNVNGDEAVRRMEWLAGTFAAATDIIRGEVNAENARRVEARNAALRPRGRASVSIGEILKSQQARQETPAPIAPLKKKKKPVAAAMERMFPAEPAAAGEESSESEEPFVAPIIVALPEPEAAEPAVEEPAAAE